MKKRNLKTEYNKIFKKGEEKVFSKFKRGINASSSAEKVIKEVNWKGKKVLDAGCGTGYLAYKLAKKGARVLAVDFSKEAIKIAKQRYCHKNLEFKESEIEKIKGKFDVIISLGVLEHTKNPFKILRKWKEMLVKNGSIIITVPSRINLKGYILMPLYFLFKLPITRADIHYFRPWDFYLMAKKLNLKIISFRTFDFDRAFGKYLIEDIKNRLPKVLKEKRVPRKNIRKLVQWLEKIVDFKKPHRFSGINSLYHFKKK